MGECISERRTATLSSEFSGVFVALIPRKVPVGAPGAAARHERRGCSSGTDGWLLGTRGWVLRHEAVVRNVGGLLLQRCLYRCRLPGRGLAMSERLGSTQPVSVLRCPNGVSPRKGRRCVHGGLGECQLQRRDLDVSSRHSDGSRVPLRVVRRRVGSRRGRRSRNDVPVALGAARGRPPRVRGRVRGPPLKYRSRGGRRQNRGPCSPSKKAQERKASRRGLRSALSLSGCNEEGTFPDKISDSRAPLRSVPRRRRLRRDPQRRPELLGIEHLRHPESSVWKLQQRRSEIR